MTLIYFIVSKIFLCPKNNKSGSAAKLTLFQMDKLMKRLINIRVIGHIILHLLISPESIINLHINMSKFLLISELEIRLDQREIFKKKSRKN